MERELKNKLLELKSYSKEDYEVVKWFIDEMSVVFDKTYLASIMNCDIKDMKKMFYQKLELSIYSSMACCFNIRNFHKQIIIDNPHLFNVSHNLPNSLKEKFDNYKLSINDVEQNYDLLFDIPYHIYMNNSSNIKSIIKVGPDNFLKIIKYHKDFYDRLISNGDLENFSGAFYSLSYLEDSFEIRFYEAVKVYASNRYYGSSNEMLIFLQSISSINMNFKMTIQSIEQLEKLNYNTMILDSSQYIAITRLGLENIIQFEKQYHLFFRKSNKGFNLLGEIGDQIHQEYLTYMSLCCNCNYDDFQDLLASYLNRIRVNKNYIGMVDLFDNIDGDFRENNAELFIDKSAPYNLKQEYYMGRFTLDELFHHMEYIPYLKDKTIDDLFESSPDARFDLEDYVQDYFEYYVKFFGMEALLEKICNYGILMNNLSASVFTYTDNKEEADYQLRKCIYKTILFQYVSFIQSDLLQNKTDEMKLFIKEHSDIFLNKDELHISESDKEIIINKFYQRELEFNFIQKYPNLKEDLKNKNIEFIFRDFRYLTKTPQYRTDGLVLGINIVDFFKLCEIYGKSLYYGIFDNFQDFIYNSFEQLNDTIEQRILDKCYNGEIQEYNKELPSFFKTKYPSIFLDKNENIDDEIYNQFYLGMDFEYLSRHKQFIPDLKNKDLIPSFSISYSRSDQIKYYFNTLGSEHALKLGISNPKTFEEMVKSHNIELMVEWYKKTNYKFVPDYVVMQTFDLNEADKFLSAGRKWSKLMANTKYSKSQENKSSLIKLAYVMGVFDGDDAGFKELYSIINDLPPVITQDAYNELFDSIKKDCVLRKLYRPSYLNELYKINSQGYYELNKKIERSKQDTSYLLCAFENSSNPINLTSHKMHTIFGGFEMKYDPDFKQFLLDHWLKLMTDEYDLQDYIVSIQSDFDKIKAANSNRILTVQLAINYVGQIKYSDIELGNESVARVCSIAGYKQEKFDTIQKIYHYTKQRVYNSIPRIANQTDKYKYEILKLNDPLGLVIGTLSNCCQELGDVAEACMQHSMTSLDGRVFVVKDLSGNIVAQSWVWRNGDVICFDNIEIPNKAFKRYAKQNGKNKDDQFAKEIFDVYKRASLELMKEDHETYIDLLKKGIINKNQYDIYSLKKVTTGLGYNDIASVIEKNALRDKNVVHPNEVNLPVKLNHSLYISDSYTQYVLESIDVPNHLKGDSLPIYYDGYDIYDKDNFTINELDILNKYLINKNNPVIDCDREDNIMYYVADYYNTSASDIKILMHPNFNIVYIETGEEIIINDLLYNNLISSDNMDIVEDQISLALLQIKNDKEIIYNKQDNKIYQKIINRSRK